MLGGSCSLELLGGVLNECSNPGQPVKATISGLSKMDPGLVF